MEQGGQTIRRQVRLGARAGEHLLELDPSGNILYIGIAMRKTASFTLDRDLLDYLSRTRGGRSRSQRANELLRRAMEAERLVQLESEAAAFYAGETPAERRETRAWQALSRRSWSRK